MYFGSEAPAHSAYREIDSPRSAQEARPRVPSVCSPTSAVRRVLSRNGAEILGHWGGVIVYHLPR